MGNFYRMAASVLFLLLLAMPAHAALYAPGETLDPACAPLDADCGVSSVVGTGLQGQVPYYAANGSVLTATSSITILANGNVNLAGALAVGDAAGTRENLGLSYASATDILASTNIATWGDSLTGGAGGTPYPTVLASLSGYSVYNGGVGGETSTQIMNRMVAATGKHSYATVIWAGRNNAGDAATVKADIATMVAALGHENYIVLSVLNGGGEIQGSPEYDAIISLNNDLAMIYGSHYLDVRAYLVSQYDSGVSQDVIDHTNDTPPSSLRSDAIHLNTAGYAAVANFIYANFSLLAASQKILTAENLRSLYFPSLGIGTSTPGAQLEVYGGNVANTSIYLSNAGTNTTDRNLSIVFRQDVGDPTNGGQGAGGRIVSGRDGLYGGSIGTHNSNLQFFVANSGLDREALRITSMGMVGIGTSSPVARLDVTGMPTNNPNTLLRISSATAAGATTTRLVLDSSGFLGLGTTTPEVRLDVAGAPTNNVITIFRISSVSAAGVVSPRLVLNSNGTLGLGTSSPETRLHIASGGTSAVLGQLDANIRLQYNGTTAGAGSEISFRGSATSTPNAVYAAISSLLSNGTTGASGHILFSTKAAQTDTSLTEVMRITSTGNVGIGTSTPSRRLTVSGTVGLSSLTAGFGAGSLCLSSTSEVVYNAGSDNCLSSTRETKHAIDSLALSELELLQKLRPVSFVYNGDPEERLRYGFIADEADAVDPHLATRDAMGKLSGLDTSGFLALIVGAVQELGEKVAGFADSFSSRRGSFETLCVGSTCITESQLQEFLRESNQQPSLPAPPATPEPSANEPAAPDAPESAEEPVAEIDSPPIELPTTPEAPPTEMPAT